MDDEVGISSLFQRRFERIDQLVGEVAHEPDRIGDQHFTPARERDVSSGRVECGEQLVLDKNIALGEEVQQTRFPCIRIPYDRSGGNGSLTTILPLHRSLGFHFEQLTFEGCDSPGDDPSVDLELCLTFAPCTLHTTSLSRQVCPFSGESGQRVLLPRQGDLQDSLFRCGPVAEDLEYHLLPVDHCDIELIFQIPLYSWSDILIEDETVCLCFLHKRTKFSDFA